MIYIIIKETNKDVSNQWVQQNCDPEGGLNTFVVNCIDSDGDNACLISFPDDGTTYAEAMKEKFGFTTQMPGDLAPLNS